MFRKLLVAAALGALLAYSVATADAGVQMIAPATGSTACRGASGAAYAPANGATVIVTDAADQVPLLQCGYVMANAAAGAGVGNVASSTILGNASGLTAPPAALNPLAVANMGNLVVAAQYADVGGIATLSGSQTITLATGSTVTSPNGATVLLTAESTSSQNGLWLVNTSGAWTRPALYPSGAVIPGNCAYLVLDLFTGTRWYENEVFGGTAVTIDTSNETWVAVATLVVGTGAATIKPEAKLAAGIANTMAIRGGDSVNASGTGNSSGSSISVQGGNPTNTATTGTMNGGGVNISAAGGSNSGAGASQTNGGAVNITAGPGGNSTTTAVGGAITITAGAGGASANGPGGNVTISPGAAGGTGTPGVIVLRDSGNNNVGSVTKSGLTLQVATVSTLPTCSSGVVSEFAVSDATAASYHGTLTGGGSTYTPVACINGTWVAD